MHLYDKSFSARQEIKYYYSKTLGLIQPCLNPYYYKTTAYLPIYCSFFITKFKEKEIIDISGPKKNVWKQIPGTKFPETIHRCNAINCGSLAVGHCSEIVDTNWAPAKIAST